MRKRQTSRLVMNGVELEPHEYETVLFLLGMGKDIELIPQSHTPLIKSPDLYMDGWFNVGGEESSSEYEPCGGEIVLSGERSIK